MSRSESIRHNAKIILRQVRGKSKSERQAIYQIIAGGPVGLIAHVAAAIVDAQKRVEVKVDAFDVNFDRIQRDIRRGIRAHETRRFRI